MIDDGALPLLFALGVLAGALSTLAGFGGGMVLLLALSLLGSPQRALAVTAPALLVANLHRLWLLRTSVARWFAAPFALGALPGSVAGGLLVAALPASAVRALMIVMTAAAFARVLGWISWKPRAAQIGPAGFGIGLLAASSGGAGLLMAPMLMTAGLTGASYVATSAAGAVAMHVGRVLGYGSSGLLDARTLRDAAVLTAALLAGNTLGMRARRRVSARASTRVELAALSMALLLAVAGVGR